MAGGYGTWYNCDTAWDVITMSTSAGYHAVRAKAPSSQMLATFLSLYLDLYPYAVLHHRHASKPRSALVCWRTCVMSLEGRRECLCRSRR